MNRIKDLRIARGLSLQGLADVIGNAVTRQALWKYEKGADQPSPSIVVKIAEALGVKALELFSAPAFTVEGLQFRVQAGFKKKERARLTALLVRVLERRIWLQQKTGAVQKSPPPVAAFVVSTAAEAEATATSLRGFWGLGDAPIQNVVQLLESQGVFVVELEGDGRFDGLCAVARDPDGTVLGVAIAFRKGCRWSRQRFSLLHELGHVVCRVSGKTDKDIEKLVNCFAGAMLIPWKELDRMVGLSRRRLTLEELLIFKTYFGASLQCLVTRLYERGLITVREYRASWDYFKQRNWLKKEPQENPPEESKWALMTALAAYAEGVLSTEEAAEFMGEVRPHPLRQLATDGRKFLELPLAKRRKGLREQTDGTKVADDGQDWDVTLDDGIK